MNILNKITMAGVLSVAVLSLNANADGFIDDFSFPDPVALCASDGNFDYGLPTSCTATDASIIGGERNVTIAADPASAGNATVAIGYSDFYGTGVFALANDPGTSSITTITYAGGVGGMDVDLTFGDSADTFAIELLEFDLLAVGSIQAWITVEDTDGVSAQVLIPNPTMVPDTLVIPYLSFAGVNFLNVASVVFEIDTDFAAVDLVVGAVRAVPEPGVIALFGLALFGMAFRRKLKNS